MDNPEKNLTLSDTTPLANIPPILESSSGMFTNKSQLKQFIEPPLLSACEQLYDKNIRTLYSSANQRNIGLGWVGFSLDFSSLSDPSKQIAQQFDELTETDGANAIEIKIPVTEKTTLGEIVEKSISIARAFQKQPATWIPKKTLQDLKKDFGISPDDTQFDNPSSWEGYYYDPKEKVFYLSEEHFIKANEHIDPA